MVKNLLAVQETQLQSLGWKDPLKKEMVPHSSVLAGKSHGQRSLAGYRPRGLKSQTRLSDSHFLFKRWSEAGDPVLWSPAPQHKAWEEAAALRHRLVSAPSEGKNLHVISIKWGVFLKMPWRPGYQFGSTFF